LLEWFEFYSCQTYPMDSKKGDTGKPALAANVASCRKKKNEEASFMEDLKDHIDEFIHASMDEHKTCFKKTVQKVCVYLNLSFLILTIVCTSLLTYIVFPLVDFRCLVCPRLLRRGTLTPPKKLKVLCLFRQLWKVSFRFVLKK